MSINNLFALLGGVFWGSAVGQFAAYIKCDKALLGKPVRFLVLMSCIAIGLVCMILAFVHRY